MKTTLSPAAPRLSLLPGNGVQNRCAICGTDRSLSRWQEHDHNDRPEARAVLLCDYCSAAEIAPHPRLYRRLLPGEFIPGSASVCMDCHWRDQFTCISPTAKFNGGLGMSYEPLPTVVTMHSRPGGFRSMVLESDPVRRCSGKETRHA